MSAGDQTVASFTAASAMTATFFGLVSGTFDFSVRAFGLIARAFSVIARAFSVIVVVFRPHQHNP